MLELTFSFDVPLEANRISSEDTQAPLDEFRQMPWIKPDYKAVTLDALRKVERYWHGYSPSALRLQPGVRSGRISFADRGRYCKEALSRRIQVISGLVALYGLREPSRCGPKMDNIDWSQFEEPVNLDGLEGNTSRSTDEPKSEDSSQTDELTFPTDQCIFCVGDVTLRTFHPRTKQRPDSLRRHVENQHLLLFSQTDRVSCPHRVCSDTGVPPFLNQET
jgi:hypothetical protein